MPDSASYEQAPVAAPPPPAALPPSPPAPRRRWPRRLAPLSLLPVAAAGIAYILAFNPTDRTPDPTGPCAWHMLFGIDGPGCGGTRMVWYLLHGDLVEAARHHLAAFIAVPFVLYAFVQWTAHWTFGVRLPAFRPSPKLLIAYGIAFVLYSTVLRNLPFAPFDWFYVADLT
ncbi:MAG: DUF2752 domain-containing protein [Micromonosporaceae bacterium]